jgi:hypothetical protein
MSPENLSRRAILAGAASVPALALPTIALASAGPDPAFAAIDAHRELFVRLMVAARHDSYLERGDEGKEEAEAAGTLARTAEDDARWELANVLPTTFAGVLALLAYLDDFYTGAFVHPDDPQNWYSCEEDWLSTFADEDIVDKFSGEPIRLPLIFWITRNIRTALQEMAVQS